MSLAIAAMPIASPAARAEDTAASPGQSLKTLQQACFPSSLTAIPGEEIPEKHDHRFDPPPSRGSALAPAAAVPAPLRGAIRRVELPAGLKLIALTFDLCEDRGEVAGYEGRIIDALRAEGVKATFFAGGKWMRSHVARTEQLMTDPLFELGNHAEAHRNLRWLDGNNLTDEILGPQRTYENIRKGLAETQCAASAPQAMQSVAPRLSLFRFPFGACNPQAMQAVNDAGLLAIQWDVSTGDPDPHVGPASILHAIARQTSPGSIVISHANGRGWHTAEAIKDSIQALKKKGYTFVTVSELLAAGKPVIADTCYDNKPGDTDRYDYLRGLSGRPRTPVAQGTPEQPPPAGKHVPTSALPWSAPDQSLGPWNVNPGR